MTEEKKPEGGNISPLRPAPPAAGAGSTNTMRDPRLEGATLGWLLNAVQIERENDATTAHDVLTDELVKLNQAIVTAMNIAGKAKGSLDIKIVILGEKGMLEPTITHKVTIPKKARTIPQMMFPTKDGGFSLHNPRQLSMFDTPSS